MDDTPPTSCLLSLPQAAQILPRRRNGFPMSAITLKRWIVAGIRGVRLRGWKVATTWYTTEASLREFLRECTAATGVRTSASKERRKRAAVDDRLRQLGVTKPIEQIKDLTAAREELDLQENLRRLAERGK